MNVASLELCKELYELSGWDSYELQAWSNSEVVTPGHIPLRKLDVPAYNLGYILTKLPMFDGTRCWIIEPNAKTYIAKWIDGELVDQCEADTPEDAACKLAIELFKQGVLVKEVI